jgi:hypothetical protein
MNMGGFSWRRFIGISEEEAKISHKIGIPFTESGRERKLGAFIFHGGWIAMLLFLVGGYFFLQSGGLNAVGGMFSGLKLPSLSSTAATGTASATNGSSTAKIPSKVGDVKLPNINPSSPEEQVLINSYPTQAKAILSKHIAPTVTSADRFSIYTWKYTKGASGFTVKIVFDEDHLLVSSSLS